MFKHGTGRSARRFLTNKFRIASSVVYALCIAVVVFVAITLFSRHGGAFGIIFSTVLSCFLTVPITLNLSAVLKEKAALEDDAKDRQLQKQRQEIAALKAENESTLRKLQLVEDTKFNIPVYQNVAKLTLKEIKRTGTIVKKERIADAKPRNYYEKIFGVSAKHVDEVLSAIDYEMEAKCGIDLKKIRVAKINDDSVVVTGIAPVYTSEPTFTFTDILGEVRHISLHHNGKERRISIENDLDSLGTVQEKQGQYKRDFEEEFRRTQSVQEDAALIKSAQNFVRVMLAPLYKTIEFESESERKDALPLLTYLQQESKDYKAKLAQSKEGRELLGKLNQLDSTSLTVQE